MISRFCNNQNTYIPLLKYSKHWHSAYIILKTLILCFYNTQNTDIHNNPKHRHSDFIIMKALRFCFYNTQNIDILLLWYTEHWHSGFIITKNTVILLKILTFRFHITQNNDIPLSSENTDILLSYYSKHWYSTFVIIKTLTFWFFLILKKLLL